MRRVATLMALVLSVGAGCLCDPEPNDLSSLPSDGAPPQADEAVDAAINSLMHRTGMSAPPSITVHWVSVMLSTTPDDADGLAIGCDLWLRWVSGSRRPSYLIAHEVSHCVRRVLTGDGDGEHVDRTWWDPEGIVDQTRIDMAANGF